MDDHMEKIGRIGEEEIIVNWIRPDLRGERGEIQRVLKEFLDKEVTEDNVGRVMDILNNSPMVELSDELWGLLENTDSFHNVSSLTDVERAIRESNQGLAPESKRDLGKLVKAFEARAGIEAPTIIKKDGVLHLVSGNTRLMICRALGVQPWVVIGEYK